MQTDPMLNDEKRKDEISNLFLISLGEAICHFLNDADLQRIRELKANIDQMFIEADKAVRESKARAMSNMN